MTHFHPAAFEQPLYILDLPALQTKLTNAGGLLKAYYEDYRTRILADAEQRADMLFLQALLDPAAVDEAADALRDFWRNLAKGDAANVSQFHTWCRGGSTTRRVAFFDWLAHQGAWSDADLEEAAEAFVGFAFKHSLQVMRSRRRASDNQIWSMSLNCAVTGFVFGHKRAAHATARHLFDIGLGRLPDIVGLFPEDGYGGEGSTYTSHVNTSLACWTARFLHQMLGEDASERAFAPNGTTLRRLIEMELHLVSPGGLLAPWDHYGWQPAVNVSPFSLLASLTGDPAYLSLIEALDTWTDPGGLAWGKDDPMWTLIWWPDAFQDHPDGDLPAELFGWFLPKTGAALDDCERRARLMQVWDACADSIAGLGRAQVNPNHVMLDVGGHPVFQDGVPPKGQNPWPLPEDKILATIGEEEKKRHAHYCSSTRGSFDWTSFIAGMAPGLPCAANCVVVDAETWHYPGASRVGRAEFYAAQDGFQAVTADSAAFYRPRYDVRRMRRTSLWTPDGFGLILDTIEADSGHAWTCQFHLRPFVAVEGAGARLAIPDGPQIRFAWDGDPDVSVTDEPGFPNRYEEKSQRLDLTQRGSAVQFAFLIAPGAATASISRAGDAVTVTIDGRTHELTVERFENAPAFVYEGIELSASAPVDCRPDVGEREDITADRDLQDPALARLVAWNAPETPGGASALAREDACFAQTKAAEPDIDLLLRELERGDWPVAVAAADALGLVDAKQAAPALRQRLEAEHAVPPETLYPPLDEGGEAEAKRWRLKAALVAALGRLGDRESVPLLGRIIADNTDPYMVCSTACQALGRIGGPDALAAVRPALQETEINCRMRARHAVAKLESEA